MNYAISIRQPWAWAVVHAGKDVENRGPHAQRQFQAAVGQRVYIHASKTMTIAEWLRVGRGFLGGLFECRRAPTANAASPPRPQAGRSPDL
jgi:hypothetical protein